VHLFQVGGLGQGASVGGQYSIGAEFHYASEMLVQPVQNVQTAQVVKRVGGFYFIPFPSPLSFI
jgi:hypothetical protein